MIGELELGAQPGYQYLAMESDADILIGGSAAGVGKSYVLCLEDIYHKDNPGFGSVTFRRSMPQIRNKGGLWDTSMKIYPHWGGTPRRSVLEWVFPSGATAKFSSLNHEQDVLQWQGSEIPLIKFDELTHFSKSMFWYMASRNRSTCGVRPYIRCTCNPDPESWVYELVQWWIDPDTGFPIPERNGVLRYLVKYGDDYIWGDTMAEVIERAWFFLEPLVARADKKPEDFVKSVTFISGTIYDNKALLDVDPGYLGNLAAQDEQIRIQLMDGAWKVAADALDVYDYAEFLGLFQNVRQVSETGRYITADIAALGSNKFVVGVWYGWKLMDIAVLDKSDGPKIVSTIKAMAVKHNVPNHNITYDSDGVGGMYAGFTPGAVAFHNGATPMIAPDDAGYMKKENYFNLKTQCFYRTSQRVGQGDMAISDEVANRMYDDKMTVRQRFMLERRAIKRLNADKDGKLRVIGKEEMKVKLGGSGESPDLMDMFAMREIFALSHSKPPILKNRRGGYGSL